MLSSSELYPQELNYLFFTMPCRSQTEAVGLLLAYNGFFNTGVYRKNIFFYQFHRARSLSNLLIQIICQPSSLQFHLSGL